MPNLLDIRRRIRSVRNTQQITKAMKMVSAARLRRAQEHALEARPYGQRLREMMSHVAAQVDLDALQSEAGADESALPLLKLLARRPEKRALLIVISSDRGLAGPFNANVVKAMLAFMDEHPGVEMEITPVGRKVRDQVRKRRLPIAGEYSGIFSRTVEYGRARELAADAMRRFGDGEVDAVYTIGNEFKSVIQQRLAIERILPLEVAAETTAAGQGAREYIFDRPPVQILSALLPRYVEMQIFRSLLESLAAEHAARMTAMDTATSNAADMIDSLTLNMNRVRQAAITKEIIEIVSGAAALGG
jgi:F-type H+-transporting ATPase subunit gamma